jgi:hypothetical protein
MGISCRERSNVDNASKGRRQTTAPAMWIALLFTGSSGCVEARCYERADCVVPKICSPEGICVFECTSASDCGNGFQCEGHLCEPISSGLVSCPEDMVAVAEAFCIDRFEASRPDATVTSAGSDGSYALSVAGVLPWQVAGNAVAEDACRASGKRLCSPEKWQLACAGSQRTAYSYGNTYDPTACNGIDTFGRSQFHLMPTGAFSACVSEWGAFDLNGNLWEHVSGGSDQTVRGGAYNCSDSAALHRCDYVPGSWTPSARGFRCCLSPAAATDPNSIAGASSARDEPQGGRSSPSRGVLSLDEGLRLP